MCGLYHEGVQVGFSRSLSDFHVRSYLADVYVLPAHRGRGLGVQHRAVRGYVKPLIRELDGARLEEDPAIQEQLERLIESAISYLAETYRDEISGLITGTIARSYSIAR